MANLIDRIRTGYNIISGKSDWIDIRPERHITSLYPSSMMNRPAFDSNKSVLAPIMNRIAIDAAAIPIRHVRVDELEQFQGVIQSELNDRLTIRANMDQSGTVFIQEAVETLLQNGHVALVPVEISSNPRTGSFDILSIRVGTIIQWFNGSVRVSLYDELRGDMAEIELPKEFVAIAYNPMYNVMNEPNSTLRRLIDRLALLDVADGKLFSPQLDVIIQLPYALKGERRVAEAERRLGQIQQQLDDSKYGIAYLDATEKITQLNRPVTNGLVETVVTLQESLHAQLGLTPAIFAGNPSQEEMVFYNNRTILPIVKALTDAMMGSFFSLTALRQGHRIMGSPSLFKMAPLSEFASAADALTRNEILTSNEIRSFMGIGPSGDPKADQLRNKNLNEKGGGAPQQSPQPPPEQLQPPVEGVVE